MLAYRWHKKSGKPVVFLHGLLGSQQDWAEVLLRLQKMEAIRPLTLDLPYHGDSQSFRPKDFADTRQLLVETLTLLIDQPFWLVGYSLGGRLALDYHFNQPSPHLIGTILEGTNLGLTTVEERQARWRNDQHWANRFRTEPIEKVLADWYQQPVFADLSACQRQALIEERKANQGENIAQMLEATSLAKQPFFEWHKRSDCPPVLQFLIGERDHKFRQLAQSQQLPHHLIEQAGHNIHRENPQAFVITLLKIINKQINQY